ncbi:ATP-binding protein [Streptomyces sp. NPDC048483]|uniref:ATP-binding protein n=1 Tax=Streptomyces sp. NPDC048483 TaxID=3154927 RepID=UPI0034449EB1
MPDTPPPLLPPSWRIALPHAPAAVPLARALVRTALVDLRAAAGGATAELVTAELVTNAVAHTRGPGPLHLVVERVPAGCQVAVHDGDPAPLDGPTGAPSALDGRPPAARIGPYDRAANADPGESGHGLTLIQALSSASGCRSTPDGKAVWFTLPA